MSAVVKPMLAKDPKYNDKGQPIVPFPCIVQPKFDGIRAFVVDGVLRSRTFKPIPNAEIQAALGRPEFNGLDGEIIVGDPTAEGCMQTTSSFVMAPSKTGENWTFHVFDIWDKPDMTFEDRHAFILGVYDGDVEATKWPSQARLVPGHWAFNAHTLESIEALLVGEGHEGVIVRDPSAPYKHGRSGTKGSLLKVKRFIDFEAEIIGVYEEMENTNEAKKDAFGRTERSTMKAGKVGKGRLGGFELRAVNGPAKGVEFRCGTGFTAIDRQDLWDNRVRLTLVGRTVKVKSFPIGVKDKPRFPVFLGFRDMEIDG